MSGFYSLSAGAPPDSYAHDMNRRLQILVVEDNTGDYLLIEQMLLEIRDFQKEILHVATLGEALQALKSQKIDVVLLDLSLPDSYGIDSFSRISQAVPHTPILILSGLNDMRFANEAVKNGAQDYLMKGEFEEKLLSKSITYSIERKNSIEMMRESQETYRLLFENNPIPMYIREKESFRIVGVNQSAVLHFGYSEEEFLNMSVTDLHPPEEVETLMRIIRENEGNFMQPAIFSHMCKDGRKVYVECRVREMKFKGYDCFLVLADDITEKRRVQEEVLFQANILRNVRDTIFVTDRVGIITYWNEGAEQTFGYTSDEMLGKSYEMLYPEIDKHLVKREIQEVIAGKREHWQTRLISQSDQIILSDNKASLITDEHGRVTGCIRVCKDITQSRRFDEKQKETVAMLNSIFNTVDQSIILLDALGRIKAFNLTANRQCIQLMGREMAENASFSQYLLPNMMEQYNEKLQLTLDGHQVHDELVYRFNAESEFWFGISFSPVTDDNNHVLGVCLSMINITERKKNDARFRSQYHEIENNNKELDKLIKVLSHDLRAPMNSINGLISLARDEKDPQEFSKYLGMMEKSIKKLESFTNDVITSLKNRGSSRINEVIPYELVQEIIEELRYSERGKHVEFNNRIDQALRLQSDPSQLQIIFGNLISNAIRYQDSNKPQAFVNVSVETHPLEFEFKVEDNGIGIDPAHHERIFETYFTVGSVEGSSGLGLSNVKDAVGKLRGRISIDSAPGRGSVFSIFLPIE